MAIFDLPHRRLLTIALAVIGPVGAVRADVATMRGGELRFDLWVESFDIRPDGVRVVADRVEDGKLAGKRDRFAGFDFETIDFRYLDESGKANPGRVATVTTPEGEITRDIVIESLVWRDDGPTFTCRRPGIPPGGETFAATGEHLRLIEFDPAPVEMRRDAQPVVLNITFPTATPPTPAGEPAPTPAPEPAAQQEPTSTEPVPSGTRPTMLILFLAGGIFTFFVMVALMGVALLLYLLLRTKKG